MRNWARQSEIDGGEREGLTTEEKEELPRLRKDWLNRGGDRAANRALHMVAISRLRVDPRTRDYAARRAAEGLSKKEVLRCLKRYLARELYKLLRPLPTNAPRTA